MSEKAPTPGKMTEPSKEAISRAEVVRWKSATSQTLDMLRAAYAIDFPAIASKERAVADLGGLEMQVRHYQNGRDAAIAQRDSTYAQWMAVLKDLADAKSDLSTAIARAERAESKVRAEFIAHEKHLEEVSAERDAIAKRHERALIEGAARLAERDAALAASEAAYEAGRQSGLLKAREIALKQCASYDNDDYQENALQGECYEIASKIKAEMVRT